MDSDRKNEVVIPQNYYLVRSSLEISIKTRNSFSRRSFVHADATSKPSMQDMADLPTMSEVQEKYKHVSMK